MGKRSFAFHGRLRIIFACVIWTPVRFRPAGAEDRIEARNSKLLVNYFEGMGSEDSHIIASDWLLWLNQNRSLVNSNPTNLASLLPLINQPQLRPEALSITTLRVRFAHLSSPNPFNNSGSNGSATASDIIHDSRLGTPQATLVGLARGPCLRRFSPRTFRPLRRFRTPNSLSDHVNRGLPQRQLARYSRYR